MIWTTASGLVCLGIGLYLALVVSPVDHRQGELVRIMYIHVPSAWLGLGIYALMALAALAGSLWRWVTTDVLLMALIPLGGAFTVVCLMTGSIWGQATWGAWWVWDARLTSMLVLALIYLVAWALASGFRDTGRAMVVLRVFILLGSINLPIVKYSVDWWRTLHQPASISSFARLRDPAIDGAMLAPLGVMTLALALLCAAATATLMRARIAEQRTRH
ncbi:MAG: heme ABC transporter permease CcmC [Pseudomonadota bacterium]